MARQLSQLLLAAVVGGGLTAGLLLLAGRADTTAEPGSAPARQSGVLAAAAAPEPLGAEQIYEQAAPGVVAVEARSIQPVSPVFEADAGPQPGISTGSGFVLDTEGRVVTSAQVVTGVSDVRVTFSNLRTVPARVVGKDEQTDLAVLQVEPEGLDLRPLELGDSDTVQIGDRALAIGNPTGVLVQAGTGVVAARGAQAKTANGVLVENLMRTDAVIVPGSAGGPVLDSQGRVIGVSSLVSDKADGRGFAVPVDTAKRVLAQLHDSHKVIRPYLGIRGRTAPVPPGGARVQAVYPGSPADEVGILPGDVVESIGGRPVTSIEELLDQVAAHRPGDTVSVTVLRDGMRTVMDVTIAERPATLPTG